MSNTTLILRQNTKQEVSKIIITKVFPGLSRQPGSCQPAQMGAGKNGKNGIEAGRAKL